LDDLTYKTPSTHLPQPAAHDAHCTSPPPTIIHALNNDRKKHGTHRAKPIDSAAGHVLQQEILQPDALPATNPPNDVSNGRTAGSSCMS